jgi:hypothetical protein
MGHHSLLFFCLLRSGRQQQPVYKQGVSTKKYAAKTAAKSVIVPGYPLEFAKERVNKIAVAQDERARAARHAHGQRAHCNSRTSALLTKPLMTRTKMQCDQRHAAGSTRSYAGGVTSA